MRKRLISVLFAMVLFSLAVCVFASCNKKHTHEFGEWTVEKQATCEENGTKVRKCNGCDETERETINALGHTYGEWVEEIPATCLAEGRKGYYECTVCNKYFDEKHIEITNLVIEKTHALSLVEGKKATCTEDGVKDVYRCLACRRLFDEKGNPVTDTVIPAKGHVYGDLIPEVPATATENGVKAHKDCTVCGLHFDDDGNELDSLVIPANEHSYSSWIEEVPATCTENGVKAHYACNHCSKNFDENYEVIADLTIPAGHALKFNKRVEPTCEKAGHIAGYTCKNCSVVFDENMAETEKFVLPALNHDFGEWQEEIPAACDTDGVKAHKTCSRCKKNFDKNERETDVVIKASHSLSIVAEVSATCTEKGRQAYGQCSVCHKYFDVFGAEITDLDDLEIPAKNHSFEEWVNAIEAACADSGLLGHYHCRNCDKDFDKDGAEIANVYVAALGHVYTTEEIIAKKDATCLEDGYVAHFECERCGAYTDKFGQIIENAVIEKTGHVSGMYTGRKDPTCTEPGEEGYYTCSKCGDLFLSDDFYVSVTKEDLVLQPTGHNYIYIEREEPTCEYEGRKEHYICNNAGCNWLFDTEKQEVSYVDLYIKPTGHDLGEWVEEKPATETEDGYIGHYRCKKCLYYFDEDKYQIGGTIVIPKTVHLFDNAWVEEVKATCTTDGTKGYYLCSHCDKKFDFDFNEIDDLTIPAHHNLSELTPASQAKCYDEDVLVAYYMCYDCGSFLDENMNVLKYKDIFREANRHDDFIEEYNEWNHVYECRDCGRQRGEYHSFEFEYVTDENNVPKQKGTCKVCGYEVSESYNVVDDVYAPTDFYVGYHNNGMMHFTLKYRGGDETLVRAASVMNEADAQRFEAILDSSAKGFETRTEKFTLSYLNFKREVEITFRPFIVYGVVTTENSYKKGLLTDLNDIAFVYDCNYTRDTGEVVRLYGTIADDGGFDPDFDFAASGLTEKTFTVKYNYLETEYDVAVTLTTDKKPAYINYNEFDYVLLGEALNVEVVYSEHSRKYVAVTDEMIINGTFDPNVLGKQTVTIGLEGLVATITVTVRDPYEISYMYLEKDTLELGEELKLFVTYLRADSETIVVTPDMIEGAFDCDAVGIYYITVVYKGVVLEREITVIDPDDSRAGSIEPVFGTSLIWNVKDGKMVENIDYLYIQVFKNNDTTEYVKVTRDMIYYDEAEAEDAVTNKKLFRLFVSYYGKTCFVYVAPREIETLNVYNIVVYDKTNIFSGRGFEMYMKDGDLSNYFVYVSVPGGYYCAPVTKDMFYVSGSGSDLSAFDVDGAESGKDYYVTLQYAGKRAQFFYLVKYSESDVKYSFHAYKSINAVVDTKEQVLERIKTASFILTVSVCGHDLDVKELYFTELVLASTDGIDFGTPGYIELTASYKGFAGTFDVCLLPDVEGAEYTTYKISAIEKLTLYKNGYVCLNESQWGTYTCINEQLKLYRVYIFDWSEYDYYTLNGEIAIGFKAEMLEDNLEIYSLYNVEGLCFVKIYTKNAFSLADFYDEDGYYRTTYEASFSADGKYVYINGKKYAFGENNMLEIPVEGNVVYRYYEETGGNTYGSGTFNDNGLFYIVMGRVAEDGGKTERVVDVYAWVEEDGIVTLYSNSRPITRGKIINGYFVTEYR